MFNQGFVIGKFHPLHAGHCYLLREARAHSQELTVVVCDFPGQEIPADLRKEWIQALFESDTKVRVDILKVDFNRHSSEAWKENVLRLLPIPPDGMFTSELETGPRYAAMLGAEHYLVDAARSRYPVSGSKIHANPARYKEYLHPSVLAWYELSKTL